MLVPEFLEGKFNLIGFSLSAVNRGCNYVISSFAWGSFTLQQTLRSLRLFIEEVMPALTGRSVPVA